jgi:hypothetical protein
MSITIHTNLFYSNLLDLFLVHRDVLASNGSRPYLLVFLMVWGFAATEGSGLIAAESPKYGDSFVPKAGEAGVTCVDE